MNAYIALKFMIKYRKKSNEEILTYMNAYLTGGKISNEQYNSLLSMMS